MSTCQSCGAGVVFVPSAKTGKAMILDEQPDKRVVVECFNGDDWEVVNLVAVLNRPSEYRLPSEAEPRLRAKVASVHLDHHASCPNSREWKGKHR